MKVIVTNSVKDTAGAVNFMLIKKFTKVNGFKTNAKAMAFLKTKKQKFTMEIGKWTNSTVKHD